MMALKVSKTFWMCIWCRSATAAKGKFSWQVSAMSTMLLGARLLVDVLEHAREEARAGKRKMGRHTYRFGECLRLFGLNCVRVGG
jgi:hypothetical protein